MTPDFSTLTNRTPGRLGGGLLVAFVCLGGVACKTPYDIYYAPEAIWDTPAQHASRAVRHMATDPECLKDPPATCNGKEELEEARKMAALERADAVRAKAILGLDTSRPALTAKAKAAKLKAAIPPPVCSSATTTGTSSVFSCSLGVDGYANLQGVNDKNTALWVEYSIDGGAAKPTTVTPGPTGWAVTVPETIKNGQSLNLSLTYTFEPGQGYSAQASKEYEQLVTDLIDKMKAAITKDSQNWPKSFKYDGTSFRALSEGVNAQGVSALDQFMTQLGFTSAGTGLYSLTSGSDTISAINNIVQQAAVNGVIDFVTVRTWVSQIASSCPAAQRIDVSAPVDEDANVLVDCLKILRAPTGDEKCKAPPLLAPIPAAADQTSGQPGDPTALFHALGKAADAEGDLAACPGTGTPANNIFHVARHVVGMLNTKAQIGLKLKPLITQVKTAAVTMQAEDLVFQAETAKRPFTLSSGALFLFRTNDVVFPLLATICPFGCLRADETSWGTPRGGIKSSLVRALSVEFGVAAGSLNTYRDPRLIKAPGFLFGASYQVVPVVRLTAGGYFFQNQQDRLWEWDPALGITLDLGTAVELLGLFGAVVPTTITSAGQSFAGTAPAAASAPAPVKPATPAPGGSQ